MKLFCIFAALAILAFSSSAKADEGVSACLAEVNATPEELGKFFQGGMKPADATDAVKCHLKCIYETNGFLKDGVFDIQLLMKDLDSLPNLKDRRDETVKLATACIAEKGANPCDTAFKVTMCLKKIQDVFGPNPQ